MRMEALAACEGVDLSATTPEIVERLWDAAADIPEH